MSEQGYFEQFTGDTTRYSNTPLEVLFEQHQSNPQLTALYFCLIRANIRSIEKATEFIRHPERYRVRMFGVTRRDQLKQMLVSFGALND